LGYRSFHGNSVAVACACPPEPFASNRRALLNMRGR
jgi:hypothetical protein